MVSEFQDIQSQAAKLLHKKIQNHRSTPQITYAEHVKLGKAERVARIADKELVYLDTNAWKCLADYTLRKTTLTAEMENFARSLLHAAEQEKFIFPIGFHTFCELDALTNPDTREILNQLVDRLSSGICIVPQYERIGLELANLLKGDFAVPDKRDENLCSPIEIIELPRPKLPAEIIAYIDQNTFDKAWHDALIDLPMSAQLRVAQNAPGLKWNNSLGIDSLNDSKLKYQNELPNLKTAILVELKGCIETSASLEGQRLEPEITLKLACLAVSIWDRNSYSKAFPTLRILSSLHGLLRFDSDRRYKNGDPNDFSIAADALSVCDAFLTDKRLANILTARELNFEKLYGCAVVSGFDNMASYLSDKNL